MRRLLAIGLILCLSLASSSCGNVFVGGFFRPNVSTVTGTVSFVEVSSVTSGGTVVQITFVTFLIGGSSSLVGFCGDQSNQLPINQQVTINFSPGQPCATLVTVIIIT